MARRTPSSLVESLDPPPEAVLKRERRTVVWREVQPDGTPVVAKLYRKQGVVTALRRRCLRFRAEREFRRLSHLRRWGIPCTEPLDWAAGWSAQHGFHELLLMRELAGAVPLREYLRFNEGPLEPLFQIVRRMHESGFCCQTLYASNILVSVDAAPGEGYAIADVPRSWTFPGSLVGTDMALYDLLDLTTELVRLGTPWAAIPLHAYGFDQADRAWWDRAVRRGDPRARPRRILRDMRARVRWSLAWAGWFLIGRTRPRPDRSGR